MKPAAKRAGVESFGSEGHHPYAVLGTQVAGGFNISDDFHGAGRPWVAVDSTSGPDEWEGSLEASGYSSPTSHGVVQLTLTAGTGSSAGDYAFLALGSSGSTYVIDPPVGTVMRFKGSPGTAGADLVWSGLWGDVGGDTPVPTPNGDAGGENSVAFVGFRYKNVGNVWEGVCRSGLDESVVNLGAEPGVTYKDGVEVDEGMVHLYARRLVEGWEFGFSECGDVVTVDVAVGVVTDNIDPAAIHVVPYGIRRNGTTKQSGNIDYFEIYGRCAR